MKSDAKLPWLSEPTSSLSLPSKTLLIGAKPVGVPVPCRVPFLMHYYVCFIPLFVFHRKHFKRVRASVVTLQKHFRKHIQRRRFVKQRKATLVLQRHRRGQVARTRVRKLREEKQKSEEKEKKKEEKEDEEKKKTGDGEQEAASEGAEKAKSSEESAGSSVCFLP